MKKWFALIVITFTWLAVAQTPTPLPTPDPIPALDGASGVIDSITHFVTNNAWLTVGLLTALEIVGRLTKTKKPQGLIVGFGRLFSSLGSMFLALDKIIAKAIPQRTEPVV